MNDLAAQVLAGVLAAIAKMIADTEQWIEWEPTQSLRDERTILKGMGAHRGGDLRTGGDRVTVVFPDTTVGRRIGHRLATAVLDQGTADLELPDTARITDAYGKSVLSW